MGKVVKKAAAQVGWTEDLVALLAKRADEIGEGGQITNEQCGLLAKEEAFVNAGLTQIKIRGKAVAEQIYRKQEANKSGTGRTRPHKVQLVSAIGTLLGGAPEGTLDSLEKANFEALDFISKRLVAQSDAKAAEAGQKA